MKSYEQIAQAAYQAHAKELNKLIGVNARPWAELPPTEKSCWIAAVKQAAAELALVH